MVAARQTAIAALTWRIVIFLVCVVLLAVLGLVILKETPIYWWMATPPDPLPVKKGFAFPTDVLQPLLGRAKGTCNVMLSQHAHTRFSDGSMSVEQVLDWHAAHNYSAVAITDHNTFKGGLEAAALSKTRGGPVALAGMEWTHCRGHYNLILPYAAAASFTWDGSQWVSNQTQVAAVKASQAKPKAGPWPWPWRGGKLRARKLLALELDNDTLRIPLAKYPTDDQMREAFAAVHALGGIVVANHLPWSAWNLEADRLPSREALVNWKVDYVELAHEMYLDGQSLPYVQSDRLGALAGTDVHDPRQRAYGWACLNATDPADEASIVAALRRPGAVDVLFDAAGTPEALALQYDDVESWPTVAMFFAPLRWVGEYFQSFYYASSSDGGPTYAYSFVDGYCGPPRVYNVRWGPALFGLLWLVILFCAYHLAFVIWAKCRDKEVVYEL